MNPREICDRYEKLYTGAVADILDEKGYRRQCLAKDLRPILPAKRAAGFAFPALGEATRDVGYDCRPEILKFLGAFWPHLTQFRTLNFNFASLQAFSIFSTAFFGISSSLRKS